MKSFALFAARIVVAAFVIFPLSGPAAAQFLTFVSATGIDTRPCTVEAQPCKSLQRAVSATGPGGTVRILSGLIGSASIAKSLVIEGGGNSLIGTITVNGASAVVTLRGLNLTGRGVAKHGIRILSAAAVHIEDSTVERYWSDAINFTATTATKLFISNTVARTSSDGLYADAPNAQVVISNSQFVQNASSGVYLKAAKARIIGSDASGNPQHGFILLTTRVKITETTADHNGGDGFAVRDGFALLDSAQATFNSGSGLHVENGSESLVNNCIFIGGEENLGVNIESDGLVESRGNNTVNGADPARPYGAY